MRRAVVIGWLVASCGAGCGYPSYGFPPGDDAAALDTQAPDTTGDAARDTTSDAARDVTADAADAPALDTASPDTGADDTTDGSAVVDSAPPPDTSVVVDAGPETGSPAGPCTGTHVFCEDFDGTSAGPSYGFDVFGTAGGGTAVVDNGSAASPPRSLACSVPDGPTTTSSNAYAVRKLTAASASALTRIDADLLLPVDTYASNIAMFKIQRWDNGHGVGLTLTPTGPALEVNGTAQRFDPLPGRLPIGRWFHFRLEARLQVTGGSYAAYVEDMTTPVLAKTGVSTIDTDTTQRQVFAGVWVYAPPVTAFTVRYDDVSVDFFP